MRKMGQQPSIETRSLVNHVDLLSENDSIESQSSIENVDIKLNLEVNNKGFLFSSNNGSCNKIRLLWEYAQTHGGRFFLTVLPRSRIDSSWFIDGSSLSNAGSSAPHRIYIEVVRLGQDKNIWSLLFDPKKTGPRIEIYLFGEWVIVPRISTINWSEDGNSLTINVE